MKAGNVSCVFWITTWVLYGTCTDEDPSALRVGWVSFEKLGSGLGLHQLWAAAKGPCALCCSVEALHLPEDDFTFKMSLSCYKNWPGNN